MSNSVNSPTLISAAELTGKMRKHHHHQYIQKLLAGVSLQVIRLKPVEKLVKHYF